MDDGQFRWCLYPCMYHMFIRYSISSFPLFTHPVYAISCSLPLIASFSTHSAVTVCLYVFKFSLISSSSSSCSMWPSQYHLHASTTDGIWMEKKIIKLINHCCCCWRWRSYSHKMKHFYDICMGPENKNKSTCNYFIVWRSQTLKRIKTQHDRALNRTRLPERTKRKII